MNTLHELLSNSSKVIQRQKGTLTVTFGGMNDFSESDFIAHSGLVGASGESRFPNHTADVDSSITAMPPTLTRSSRPHIAIPIPYSMWLNRVRVRGEWKLHMTITNPNESIETRPDPPHLQTTLDDFKILGIGKLTQKSGGIPSERECYFYVVACPSLQLARHQMGLSDWKDFHITLGFNEGDIHDHAVKGPRSILNNALIISQEEAIKCVKQHISLLSKLPNMRGRMFGFCEALLFKVQESLEFKASPDFYAAQSIVYIGLKEYDSALAASTAGLELDSNHLECLVRYGDSCLKIDNPKEALTAFWKAFIHSTPASTHYDYCISKLIGLWKDQVACLEFAPASRIIQFTQSDWNTYYHKRHSLLIPNNECRPVSVTDTRFRHTIPQFQDYALPRFFSFLVPFVVAGMSTPICKQDILALEMLGIRHCVSLTAEEPLDENWFLGTSVKHTFWPIENYYPVAIGHVDAFLNIVQAHLYANDESDRGSILVHCGGGKGRAGTLLACYLSRFGLKIPPPPCDLCRIHPALFCNQSTCFYGTFPTLDAQSSIQLIRELRPGSIERERQEEFVTKYVSEIWQRVSFGKRVDDLEDMESDVIDNVPLKECGELDENGRSKLLVLCGLPGSGKSWFAERLEATNPQFVRIAQDDLGSKDACIQRMNELCNQKGSRKIVIDRCNPTALDRVVWKTIAEGVGYIKNATIACIYFDASPQTCIDRIGKRLTHPTLNPHSGPSVVTSFSKQFEPPSLESDAFDSIIHVSSFAGARKLLLRFGGSPSNSGDSFFKYPRTRHLFDLGSATRDDLVLSEDESNSFLNREGDDNIVFSISEKVDGANVGIRFDAAAGTLVCQNRTHIITSASHPQFSSLRGWLHRHESKLKRLLYSTNCILFGEWMQARHSIHYDQLDDLFCAFDLFDLKHQNFWSVSRFRKIIRETTDFSLAPLLDLPPQLTKSTILELINQTSAFSTKSQREGVVIRRDRGEWMDDKAKIVRTNFLTAESAHWSTLSITSNSLREHL